MLILKAVLVTEHLSFSKPAFPANKKDTKYVSEGGKPSIFHWSFAHLQSYTFGCSSLPGYNSYVKVWNPCIH